MPKKITVLLSVLLFPVVVATIVGILACSGSDGAQPTAAGEADIVDEPRIVATPTEAPTIVPTILEGHTDGIRSLAFSPDGQILVTGSSDHTVRLWQVSDGAVLHKLEDHTDMVWSVAFSPDGRTVASGSYDGRIILFDAESGAVLRSLIGHTGWVNSLAFSPDRQTLASGSGGSDDNTVRLWRLADGTLLHTLDGHITEVTSVAFSPDGQTVASGSSDSTIRLWQITDDFLFRTLEGHTGGVMCLAFSPDGQTLASGSGGSDDNTVRLWRLADGTLLQTLDEHGDWVVSVAFSPDGRILASGSKWGKMVLFDTASGAVLQTMTDHRLWVNSLAFTPDGQTLASGSGDGTVRLWPMANGDVVRGIAETIPSIRPTSLVVANTDGQGVYIRRTTDMADRIKAWPDGTTMIVVGDDQTAEGRIWKNVEDPDGGIGFVPAEYLAVPSPTPRPTATPDLSRYQLELLASRGTVSRSFMTIEGQVKNISANRLSRVQAIVESYDADGTFISSATGFVEYDPILPNQITPFKVIKRYNPEMKSYRVTFKQFLGGTIPTLYSTARD